MQNALEVTTYHGAVRGNWADETAKIRAFRGIPYARPPVDELRWQPPQAPQSWTGIRNAGEPGPACWQAIQSEAFVWSRGEFPRSEDCLYLNIWSRAEKDDQAVMVWFHGGAHTSGMAHEKIFDGTELARRGVVLITVNYRLGALGFLAHPLLAAQSNHNSSGNYGLLDKIAALNWVRDNVAQFGGDPNNITIFGQSAGSQSVCALMASPLADGLFHKAIGQSAACISPITPKDANGYLRGEKLIAALDAPKDIQALRQLSPQAFVDAAVTSGWANESRIVVDGWVLPEQPKDIYAAGQQAKVPLLLGSLANEGYGLIPLNEGLTAQQLGAYVEQLAGAELAGPLLKLYARQAAESPAHAQRDITADLFMAHGMRSWARYQHELGAPTYLYFMDHIPPAFRLYWPDNPDLQLPGGPRSAGAYHSGDLAYVFGNTHKVGLDWQPDDHALADLITRYWTNFAKTGNPNGQGLPAWLPYEPQNQSTQLLRPSAHTVAGVRREVLDLWDRRFF